MAETAVENKTLGARSSHRLSSCRNKGTAPMGLDLSVASWRTNQNIRALRHTAWLMAVIAGMTMQATNALAQVAGSDASLAAKIADGRSWRITMEDGRVGALTLFQNGTGKMAGGPMELAPKWRPTRDGLCLKPGALLPERCVRLVRTSSGYIGLQDGKQAFKLER